MRVLNKSSEYEDLYQKLGNQKDSLFKSMKDVFLLAAVLGQFKDSRKPYAKKGGDGIKENIFNYNDKIVLDFISVNATKDINILSNDQDEIKCKLLEEYANGGMEILDKYLADDYLNIDKLIRFVKEIDAELSETIKPNIEDILIGLALD